MKEFPARSRRRAHLIAVGLLLCIPHIAAGGGDSRADAAGASGPPAGDLPADNSNPKFLVPYRAKYALIKTGTTLAQATYTLAQTPKGWEFRAHAKPTKMVALIIDSEIDEYSLLALDNGHVKPIQYEYTQKNDKDKNSQSLQVQYDWPSNIATVNNGSKSQQLAIGAGTHDPLSVQLALMQHIKKGCREARYTVIDKMELQKRRFECGGTESVSTALGKYEAVRVSYRHGKRETITWLAPELNYIPVRIQQFRNSDLQSEMRITAVNFE
jgi:hypothetical protein